MTVRVATSADYATVKALIALFPEKLMQAHLPEPEEFFVAQDDGQIIACCALEVYSQRLAEIRSLAVKKEFQRNGVATALVEACLAQAKRQGIHEVLAITGADELFEKHGFGSFKNERYALIKLLD